MIDRALLAGVALLAILAPSTSRAQTAQTGAPAFRVPLKEGTADPGVPAVWAWVERITSCSATCGSGTRSTTYECQDIASYDWQNGGYGVAEPNTSCEAVIGPGPASTSEACTNYSSCSYDWVVPGVVKTASAPGRIGCGEVRVQFDPYCRRSDGSVLATADHAFCQNDRPDYDLVAAGNPDALGYDRTVAETSACSTSDNDWKTGGWSSWSNTCSANATHTRAVTCVRRFDGAIVADSQCDAGSKPAASETQPVYDSCSYTWDTGAWSDYSSTCSASAVRTRAVTCKRSNGDTVPDASCSTAKPDATETSAQYGSCGYSAANWGSPTYSSTCSATATKTETAQCLRSDGTIVASSECASRSIALTRTSTEANYSTCGYSWDVRGWSASSSTCSTTATQTRSVTCHRSDGSTVPDASCSSAGAKPGSSQTVADYSTCGYSAGGTPSYGSWSSTCSSNASRNRHMQCIRSNGDVVADSECTSRGISLDANETAANYSSCGYDWQNGAWSASSSTCSASAQQTRSVWCQRSDGTTVADASCNAASRPAASQTIADYSGCGYSQGPITSYGAWSSTCSASATRSEFHSCRRSDGTAVADSECTSRGVGLTTTSAPTAVYDGCGFSWQTGGWSASTSTCSASAQQTRSVWCQRSDGATVADASCGGGRPQSSQTLADYSGCGYSAGGKPSYGAWASGCSGSTTRNKHLQCVRSDNAVVPDGECTSRGVALDSPESGSNYSSCGYSPSYGNWSACSNSSQTRAVTCTRSDGASVDPSYCGVSAPGGVQSQSCSSGPTDCNSLMKGLEGNQYYTIQRPLGGFNGTSDYAPLRGYVNSMSSNYDAANWTYSNGQCHATFNGSTYIYCDIPVSTGTPWSVQSRSACTAI